MAGWNLKLFGEFRLSSSDGKEITALGRRDRAVLSYLVLCPGQRAGRERLAALIWSNRQDEQARHSLAQSTAVIRKALDDAHKSVVMSDAESLAIDGTAFNVDVVAFQELIGEGTLEALHRAGELYSGDLLQGVETRSEGFDEWLQAERNRLRSMATDALSRLADLYADAEDWDRVIEVATRVLDMDPLREDAHRSMMLAYAQSGRRALALQQFNTLTDVLDSELQVGPDPETQGLMEAIRKGADVEAGVPFSWPDPESGGRDGDTEVNGSGGSGATEMVPSAPVRRNIRVSNRLFWAAGGLFVLLLAVAVAVSATYWRVPELAPAPIGAYIRGIKEAVSPHPLSIAVLPFESYGDADAKDFADALSGGITTALSISSDMLVVARSSVRAYGKEPVATEVTAKDLRVRYILEGAVQKWNDQIAIDIGLVDTTRGQHRVWSETYRRQMTNIIQAQLDITFEVITSLQIRLTEGEQERINRMHGTRILGAWLAAAQAQKHLRRLTAQDTLIARANYERAIKLDPDYPGAWDGLAWTYFVNARFGWTNSPESSMRKAMELAERTLALDPDRPRTYSLLGSVSLLSGDFSTAVSLGERAVSLGPTDADAAALLAYTLTYTGEPERATSLIKRAIRLRPQPPQWYKWLLGRATRLAGRFDEAIKILSTASEEGPSSHIPLVELAAAYSEIGSPSLARATTAKIMRLSPEFTVRAWIAMSPYKDSEALEREVAALQSAGLPQ